MAPGSSPCGGAGTSLYQGTRQDLPVQQPAPVEALNEVAHELTNLAAGLQYARTAVARAADPTAVVLRAGEAHA